MGRVANTIAEIIAEQGTPPAAVLDHLGRARYCEHPITLKGLGINKTTGEVSERKTYVTCGSRRRSKCVACSDVYSRDAYTVASSGWQEGISYAWITLTAPGREVFGCQHHTFAGRDGKRRCTPKRKCPGCGKDVPPCKRFHKPGDPLIGVPVCDCFDYEKAAAFNTAVPALWVKTMRRLNDEFGEDGRLPFLKVAEWQRRGLVHIHVLVRGIEDTERVLSAVRAARAEGFAWGENSKVEIIAPHDVNRAKEAFRYIVKYATKSVADHRDREAPALRLHLAKLRHTAQIASEGSARVAAARGDGLGFGGHVLTKSHAWGTTFKAIRDARQEFAAKNGSGEGFEWSWWVAGRGYTFDTAEHASRAALLQREVRRRLVLGPAPPLPAESRRWVGSVETDDGCEVVWLCPDGSLTETYLLAA